MSHFWPTKKRRTKHPVDGSVLVVKGVPNSFKMKLKCWCSSRGITIQDMVLELVNDYVRSMMALGVTTVPHLEPANFKRKVSRNGKGVIFIRGMLPMYKAWLKTWCYQHQLEISDLVLTLIYKHMREVEKAE